jgi:dTDP-4-amino-4,6-dideoxygalactose transaminase
MGLTYGCQPGDLPITEDLSGRLLRLPFYHDLSVEDQQQVIQAVTAYLHDLDSADLDRAVDWDEPAPSEEAYTNHA